MPVKDSSTIAATEKKVKSILNKMTKEKFEKLATQMIDIPISSFEILSKMIHYVYEKAIYEPSFGDIYAELCTRLSLKAKQNPFVKVIESDEEPPTEDGEIQEGAAGASSHNTVYRWSNDVSTDDSEIIGPFGSIEECLEAAIDADNCPEPRKRESEMVLDTVRIYAGQFVKIMHSEDNPKELFTVFFPVSKAEEIGQQMSGIFLSEIECFKDGNKKNSFKGILLNKCQDEFNKKNVYDEWKVEKAAYDKGKSSLSDSERLEKEEELEFRRMKIKKQVLGNIRFIGELFKIGMLKTKVMRDCIESILKLEQEKDANGNITGNVVNVEEEMDEEDHEAVCKLFTTIGSTIDHGKVKPFIDVYFSKISTFSDDKSLNARSRFLYKDLIDLRNNNWKARREEETAKTLNEIKKDFERDERRQQMQSQQMNNSYRGNRDNRRGQPSRGDSRRGDYHNDNRRSQRSLRAPKERVEPKIDKDGFTEVPTGRGSMSRQGPAPKLLSRDSSKGSFSKDNRQSSGRSSSGFGSRQSQQQQQRREPSPPRTPSTPAPEPMSKEKLENRSKNMVAEFMQESNKEELLLSMDECLGTPDAGRTIVQASVDRAIDCKDAEREAIISVLSILFTNDKLTSDDIGQPFADIVEFIDSFVVDSPRAMDYMGDMMAEFLHIKALDVNWLCTQTKKHEEFSSHLIPDVIKSSLKSMITRFSIDEARVCFGNADNALRALLSDKWDEVAREAGLV